jgi:esterase/lipase
MIVPINISYSNIRNGKNFLVDMTNKLLDDMGNHFKEEIEIESNIVLNSKITIRILEPISTKNILEKLYKKNLPKEEIINKLRYEITHSFMDKIYESLTINFDHIFVLILFLFPKKEIEIEYFKRLIYITIFKIKEKNIFYDSDINKDLIYLISYEKFKAFDNILEVAINDKILQVDEINCYKYIINKKNLLNSFTHHTIRMKNILKVILNEILIHEESVNIVKNLVSNNEEVNLKELVNILKYEEEKEYETSYEKFKNSKDIKPVEIAKSKYFEAKESNNCVIAIHGFGAAPKEMEKLAQFLNENNFNVQTPRLAGHGTAPEDLKTKTWQDWYKSISRSIIIASLQYKKIFIVGFSTGGLLALLSTKKQYKEFVSVICINAALHLNDMRIKTLLPAISFWNDIVKVFHEEKYTKEYVDNFPENPDINYNKHYIDSIEQLNLLMNKTKKILPKIKKPILIIQGKDDPVVNPSSAHEIFENIQSRYKTLHLIEAKNHVIVTDKNTNDLFIYILNFLKQG